MPKLTIAERGRGEARDRLLEAAEACLVRDGYAALSTRAVAAAANTPLSQIHYHFGSKQGLVLGLLKHQNAKLLARQSRLFGADAPLSARWLQACDFLEEDVASGYVRVLQEIISAGYADLDLAAAARTLLSGWFELLTQVSLEARASFGETGLISDAELGTLIGLVFLGAETMILLDLNLPIHSALRAVGSVLACREVPVPSESGHAG